MTRKICLITGSRAEYGHLRRLAREVVDDPELQLQWLITGAHLSERFGLTRREIEADGFTIDEQIEMIPPDDSPTSIAKSVGKGITGMTNALERLDADILVILGDRYEMLAAASTALILGIPIAHVHGGEVTEGAFDDAIRHAITKMAHLHFVAAEPYRRRVIQMGEDPQRVFTVGAPSLDDLLSGTSLDGRALEHHLDFPIGEGFFLVTYHPATLESGDAARPVREMLTALDAFPDRKVLITGVNADPGHDGIAQAMTDYAAASPERVAVRASLGETAYISAMRLSAVVIGNSSSGIIEAPALGKPTVNIGDRQKGRLRAPSVIDCAPDRQSIRDAVARALEPDFHDALNEMTSHYGRGGASRKIKDRLKRTPLEGLTRKRFHDLPQIEKTACVG